MVKKIIVKDGHVFNCDKAYYRLKDIDYLHWLVKGLRHNDILKLIKIAEGMDEKYHDPNSIY